MVFYRSYKSYLGARLMETKAKNEVRAHHLQKSNQFVVEFSDCKSICDLLRLPNNKCF